MAARTLQRKAQKKHEEPSPASLREPAVPIPRPAQLWTTQQDERFGGGGWSAPASGTQVLIRQNKKLDEFLPMVPSFPASPPQTPLSPSFPTRPTLAGK